MADVVAIRLQITSRNSQQRTLQVSDLGSTAELYTLEGTLSTRLRVIRDGILLLVPTIGTSPVTASLVLADNMDGAYSFQLEVLDEEQVMAVGEVLHEPVTWAAEQKLHTQMLAHLTADGASYALTEMKLDAALNAYYSNNPEEFSHLIAHI